MTATVMGLAILALASMQDPADRDREAEARVRALRQRLDLTQEQADKALEIYKEDREAADRLEKERHEKIRGLLTDDQKTRFNEMVESQRGGRGFGPAGRGLNGLERELDALAENLPKELSLAEEQGTKVKEILDEFKKAFQERVEGFRRDGFRNFNFQEEMNRLQEKFREHADRIRQELTDEQKPRFDRMLEEFRGRVLGPFGGRREVPSGDRRPSIEDRTRRALEVLKGTPEEEAAWRDLVRKTLEAEAALREYEREARAKIDELERNKELSDDELSAKLQELRDGRTEKDRSHREAQEELKGRVSVRQELDLIRQGVLR